MKKYIIALITMCEWMSVYMYYISANVTVVRRLSVRMYREEFTLSIRFWLLQYIVIVLFPDGAARSAPQPSARSAISRLHSKYSRKISHWLDAKYGRPYHIKLHEKYRHETKSRNGETNATEYKMLFNTVAQQCNGERVGSVRTEERRLRTHWK